MEATDVCRVCLQTQQIQISLFASYKHANIADIINLLSRIDIKENDGLPNKICPTCLSELDIAYNFTEKCRNSDFILNNSSGEIKQENGLDETNEELKKEEETEPEEVCDDAVLDDAVHDDAVDDDAVLDDSVHDDAVYDDAVHDDAVHDDFEEKKLNEIIQQHEAIPQNPYEDQFECHDCGNQFKSKCKLRVHWKKVHFLEQILCKICKKQCKTYKTFNNHLKRSKYCNVGRVAKIEGIGKNRMFYCKECDYKSKHSRNMWFHTNSHTGFRPYVCKICSKGYFQSGALNLHLETAHKLITKHAEIICQHCGKLLQGRRTIYDHLLKHKEKEVQCDICKKILKNKNTLTMHMLTHQRSKSYSCDKCLKLFTTQTGLRNHINSNHNAQRGFLTCNICSYKCRRGNTLKKHKMNHTGSNVCCFTCGNFFENAKTLKVHQQRHINLDCPCPECGKMLFDKTAVRKHLYRVHKLTVAARNSGINNKQKQKAEVLSD